MTKAIYTAEARIIGGRANGRASTSDGLLKIDLRLPKEMGGSGGGVNPEQLLAIGHAACFAMVLQMLGQKKDLDVGDPLIDSRVSLIPKGDGTFKLGVELDITLTKIGDQRVAMDLVRAAHGVCPYSNALRGNVDVALTVNDAKL